MKAVIVSAVLVFFTVSDIVGQGYLQFINNTALTRIGSLDGPLAGTNIAARMLAGLSQDSLAPFGPTGIHLDGLVYPEGSRDLYVPGIPGYTVAHVQMWAWNWQQWGWSMDQVSPGQFGKTDVVAVALGGGTLPFPDPIFTQPAIVPLVPEPAALTLGLLGAGMLALRFRTWRLAGGYMPNQPGVLREGSVAWLDHRWGDYSATTVDPADDWSFWAVQQYAADMGLYQPWKTAVARIRPSP